MAEADQCRASAGEEADCAEEKACNGGSGPVSITPTNPTFRTGDGSAGLANAER
jgi:hypothetical protein